MNIKIIIPNNNIQEREYVINFVFSSVFDKNQFSIDIDESIEDYIVLINDKKLIVKDVFFSLNKKPLSYLSKANIPEKLSFFKFHQSKFNIELPVLFGTDKIEYNEDKIICFNDVFATIFYMLSRYEEYVQKNKIDKHNRFNSLHSLAVKHDFIDKPIVDYYVLLIKHFLEYLGVSKSIFRKEEYKLTLSHDIDVIGFYDSKFRVLKHLIKSLKSPSTQYIFKIIKGLIARKDPYFNFEKIMDISEKNGVQSEFFFMAGGTSKVDNFYNIFDKRLTPIFAELKKRNHVIGFHPSYNSYNDRNLWEYEKNKLAEASNAVITKGRQHYLRFTIPETYRIWDEFEMEIDSTLGYADTIGFRCGTSKHFKVFDILKREQLSLTEEPLIVMDTSLFKYMSLNNETEIFEKLINLKKHISNVNGNFTLLWHNTSFDLRPWKSYDFYEKIIKVLQE